MADSKKRGQQGSIYAYETDAGTRFRFTFRDPDGKQTTRRGFVSRRAARAERERLMGRVHTSQLFCVAALLAGEQRELRAAWTASVARLRLVWRDGVFPSLP